MYKGEGGGEGGGITGHNHVFATAARWVPHHEGRAGQGAELLGLQ